MWVLYSCIDVRHVADAEEHRGRAEDRQGDPQVMSTVYSTQLLYSTINMHSMCFFANCDMSIVALL